MAAEIAGTVAPGFERVGDSFAELAPASHGHGASLHIRVDGDIVADLWTESADEEAPWTADTPTVFFSCTKGLVSVLAGELVKDGALDLDRPVTDCWPEFGAQGKGETTVRQVFAHRAGLPTLREDLTKAQLLDWDFMAATLAAEKPFWIPGEKHLYHAMTFGWLAGEIIRRTSGLSVGALLNQRISGPLGADAWIGVPDDVLPKVPRMFMAHGYAPAVEPPAADEDELAHYSAKGMFLGSGIPHQFADPGQGFNDPDIMRGELPGANGIGTARGLATIWSATVSGNETIRLLTSDIIGDMRAVQSEGQQALGGDGPFPRWGTGFILNSEGRPLLSDTSFGHDGVGGQLAFADETHKVGFGFVTNDLHNSNDPRSLALVHDLRALLR